MAETLKPNERLVCVGATAMRAPDGSFLPSAPLYVKVSESEVNSNTGLSKGEEELMTDIGGVLAQKFKQYVDGIKELEQSGKEPKCT